MNNLSQANTFFGYLDGTISKTSDNKISRISNWRPSGQISGYYQLASHLSCWQSNSPILYTAQNRAERGRNRRWGGSRREWSSGNSASRILSPLLRTSLPLFGLAWNWRRYEKKCSKWEAYRGISGNNSSFPSEASQSVPGHSTHLFGAAALAGEGRIQLGSRRGAW